MPLEEAVPVLTVVVRVLLQTLKMCVSKKVQHIVRGREQQAVQNGGDAQQERGEREREQEAEDLKKVC